MTLTGYADAQLADWLDEIRKVAALRGQDAIDATDSLLWSFLEWRENGAPSTQLPNARDPESEAELDHWEASALDEQLIIVREAVQRLRDQLAYPAGLRPWDADLLIQRADELGRHTHRRVRERFADAIAEIRHDAHDLADQVRLAFHEQAIRGAGTQPIHNVRTLDAIHRQIEQAMTALAAKGKMTPELRTISQAARDRLARYRAKRKLAEAEVAEAGGSSQRAERLRREAQAMLVQDVARYYPEGLAAVKAQLVPIGHTDRTE